MESKFKASDIDDIDHIKDILITGLSPTIPKLLFNIRENF
jgi:hypothetical protein